MGYTTILADPPWRYKNVEGPRAAPSHRPNSWDGVTGCAGSALRYGSMALTDICSLRVKEICEPNAHLYLWTTNSFMDEAHDVCRAWGFRPTTIITWAKLKKGQRDVPSMKMGYYLRSATEHILFGVRGSLRLLGPPRPTLIFSERLPHSVKPDVAYQMIEACSPAARLELFARKIRPGWDAWGNEVASGLELNPAVAS